MSLFLHVDRRKTDLAVVYPWWFDSFARKVFRERPTEHLSDQFAVYDLANQERIYDATPIGEHDLPRSIRLVWGPDIRFKCQVFGLSHPYHWLTETNADPSLDYSARRAMQLTHSLRYAVEKNMLIDKIRNPAFTTANLDLDSFPTMKFDAYTSGSSQPIALLERIADNIGYANMGRKPNVGGFTTHVLKAIKRSEEYKDYTKFTAISDSRGIDRGVSNGVFGILSVLEQLVGVEQGTFSVVDYTYNGAPEGQDYVRKAFMGSDVFLCWAQDLDVGTGEEGSQAYGQRFQYTGIPNAETAIIEVPQYGDGMIPGPELRAVTVYDAIQVRGELGFLIRNTLDNANTAAYNQLFTA